MTEFPFCQHTIRVEGVSVKTEKLTRALSGQYARKEQELIKQTIAIECWMDTIKDSRIRQIIRLRYEDGLAWREVSRRVYGKRSENRARMALNRYFTQCS